MCLKDLNKRKDLIHNSPRETVLLEEMEAGQRGKILTIEEHSDIDHRLSGLGISSGNIVEVEGQDTVANRIGVKVRGYHLSLRKNDAAKISIELYK
jgi:Fe2+ transport system protein FeoA